MSVKLLTEQHLEFLSLTGGCTGSSKSTLVKMPHCSKPHAMAHLSLMVYVPSLKGEYDQEVPQSQTTAHRQHYDLLCTISVAISYVSHLFVLSFVQYRTISIATTRTGS